MKNKMTLVKITGVKVLMAPQSGMNWNHIKRELTDMFQIYIRFQQNIRPVPNAN